MMVSPDSRTMLTAALRPPPGMAFDAAVATTYSLDPALALTLPVLFSQGTVSRVDSDGDDAVLRLQRLRSHAESITVFVQAGCIKVPGMLKPSPAYALLEPMVYQVSPSGGGVFHPKVVLARYLGDDGSRHLRLVVMTRNLTFDKSWDVAVILDGDVCSGYKTARNEVLAKFVQSLAGAEGLPERRRAQIHSLRTDIGHVRFDLPEGYSQYAFHAPRTGGVDWIPRQKISRWGLVSPFLTKGALDLLGRDLPEPSFVLARDEEIARLDGVPNGKVLRDVGDLADGEGETEPIQGSGLHAKCYMYDYTYMNLPFTRLVVGSGNATSAALVNASRRNVEFMVSLSGKRMANGVADFAEAMEPYWEPFEEDGQVVVDEALEDARNKLEDCRRRMIEIGFQVECARAEDGQVAMTLRTQHGRRMDGFDGVREIRAFPITLPSASSRGLSLPEKSWHLATVRAESATGLIAFEILSDRAELRESFVLNLPVKGMPPDRDELILASVLSNRAAFLHFLLLEDGSSGGGGGGLSTSPMGLLLKAAGNREMPLADCLLRAYCRSPKVLGEIARAIAAADRAGGGTIPEDFRELWSGFAPLAEEGR